MVEKHFVPFREFVRSVASMQYDDISKNPHASVESVDAFNQMKQHVLSLYDDIDVPHSFIERGGQVVDCVPIKEPITPQPTPPPRQHAEATTPDFLTTPPIEPSPQLHPEYRDQFGNQMWCPSDTTPMIRVTLDKLAQFKTLADWQQRTMFRLTDPQIEKSTTVPFAQRSIETTGVEGSIGQGCRATMNIWSPAVGPNDMSMYLISAIAFEPLQWVSCGFLISPQLFGHSNPTIMVSYNNGLGGCINRFCSGFVQQSANFVVGAPVSPTSIPGGQQYELTMTLFLKNNMWQFFIGNEFVGFYPATIFQNGDLKSINARISAGGLVQAPGAMPAMGSGAFPNAGFGRAAYMRNIEALGSSTTGGPDLVVDARLQPFVPSPQCYNMAITNSSATPSRTFFLYGGPGGTNC